MKWYYLDKQFPKIYTEKSFFHVLKVKKKDYLKISKNKKNYFRTYEKKKSNGSTRMIYVPNEEISYILKQIRNLFRKLNYPPYVHNGVKGRSVSTALLGHSRYKTQISVDIEKFFDSVTKETLEVILLKVGFNKKVVKLLIEMCTENNSLPQGFHTSSVLSSLVLAELLTEVDNPLHSKFSFYADDGTISCLIDEDCQNLKFKIENKITSVGLKFNKDKEQKSVNDISVREENKNQLVTHLGLKLHPYIKAPRKDMINLKKEMDTFLKTGKVPQNVKLKRGKHNHAKTNNEIYKTQLKGRVEYISQYSKSNLVHKIQNKYLQIKF